MALKDTVEMMRGLLALITVDLEKAVNGNKAAAQRVRTATIQFEKIAKIYRKESIRGEKSARPRRVAKAGASSKSSARRSSFSRISTKSKPRKASRR